MSRGLGDVYKRQAGHLHYLSLELYSDHLHGLSLESYSDLLHGLSLEPYSDLLHCLSLKLHPDYFRCHILLEYHIMLYKDDGRPAVQQQLFNLDSR